MKIVKTQIATSFTSDFEENTWTFLMPDNYKVWAGQFAIVDAPVYNELLAALREAKKTIKSLHGEVGWEIYDQNSPEMKKINQAIKNAE